MKGVKQGWDMHVRLGLGALSISHFEHLREEGLSKYCAGSFGATGTIYV